MSASLFAIVQSAASQLIEHGELPLIGQYFSQDYVVHLTGQDYGGGHKIVQAAINVFHAVPPCCCMSRCSPSAKVNCDS